MLILLYIVYISLYLCKMHEVHSSYSLKYAIRTNYLKKDKQYLVSLPLPSVFMRYNIKPFIFIIYASLLICTDIHTLCIVQTFIISNQIQYIKTSSFTQFQFVGFLQFPTVTLHRQRIRKLLRRVFYTDFIKQYKTELLYCCAVLYLPFSYFLCFSKYSI